MSTSLYLICFHTILFPPFLSNHAVFSLSRGVRRLPLMAIESPAVRLITRLAILALTVTPEIVRDDMYCLTRVSFPLFSAVYTSMHKTCLKTFVWFIEYLFSQLLVYRMSNFNQSLDCIWSSLKPYLYYRWFYHRGFRTTQMF